MKPQIFDRKLFVSLGSAIDPYRFSQYSNNQKFEELQKPNGLVYFEVNSLLEAKNLTQKFIEEFDLAGSNWVGGRVVDEENNFIAQISYNGRVWDSENHPSKEIEI
ncbi:hypothetical protein [Chryseobacterium binzhouense]|uniref:hypothetical protein n=1 Tax=Chryseobacterium binzhouense TaxID=2593646 RepID=UPI00289C6823|nr:hypothetical protein [Chryseobacterium binzhouense]